MRRLDRWLIGAALGAALAGFAGGMAVCQARASDEFDLQAADRTVVDQYRSDFDLRNDQVVLLRAILRALRDTEATIYRRNVANLPANAQSELDTARRAADKRIKFMLDAEQQARYEQRRGKTPETNR